MTPPDTRMILLAGSSVAVGDAIARAFEQRLPCVVAGEVVAGEVAGGEPVGGGTPDPDPEQRRRTEDYPWQS